ncbi:GGDEF domain-containing protein [Devosia sp. Naph2]|uniref:GGDEF domain-containing protein n=1 Tax=Devosia polycyclovorans TaxID=3345148 RepID=UPI0035CFB20F
MFLAFVDILGSISDLGFVAALTIAFRELSRLVNHRRQRALLMGALFGATAWFSSYVYTSTSVAALPDNAFVFVGLAAAFFGRAGLLTAFLVPSALLSFLGELSVTEVVRFGLSGLAGLVWSVALNTPGRRRFPALAGLGLALNTALVTDFLFERNLELLRQGPEIASGVFVTVLTTVLITALLGLLMDRERHLLASELRLLHLANTDELTGLNNRRALLNVFDGIDATDRALLIIDIDNFKSVNDSHGHSAGDKVIRHVAEHLQASIRSGDLLCRYGGEEFAAIIRAGDEAEAVAAAERIRLDIEGTRVRIGQLALQVTVSLGVAWLGKNAEYSKSFDAADHALYKAKRSGRNRVVAAQVGVNSDKQLAG